MTNDDPQVRCLLRWRPEGECALCHQAYAEGMDYLWRCWNDEAETCEDVPICKDCYRAGILTRRTRLDEHLAQVESW